MLLIIALVFVGVFAIVALPLIAGGSASSRQAKQMVATLDSALTNESKEAREQIVNLRKDELLSSIPWLNRKLLKLEFGPAVQSLLDQAGIKWTAGGLLAACAAGFAIPAYLIDLRFGMILPALGVGLALGSLPFLWVLRKRSSRFEKFLEKLPGALDLLVSALRAGHSLVAAMSLVARECPDPIGVEFRICFEEQNYGLELKTAMENMLKRIPLQDLRITVTAIMIQKECGGNLAEVLEKTSHAIRERFRLRRQVQVHTAQGRLTGCILTLLPVALGAALFAINPQMMSILWTRSLGIKLLWTSAGMTVLGGLIIRQIVNMEV
ncbi:MAG: type II secretion system F family protein [Terracidiphilus sp.]